MKCSPSFFRPCGTLDPESVPVLTPVLHSLTDLRNNYIPEGAAQFGIEYTCGQIYGVHKGVHLKSAFKHTGT